MPESVDPLGLLRVGRDDYGDAHGHHLLEQYKLYVEMADRISARRHSANSYFLSANTLLVAVAGLLFGKSTGGDEVTIAWRFAIPIAGITLCVVWYFLIASYRQLNTGKFKVVHEMERLLPAAPYDAEWKALGEGLDRKRYWPFTHIERAVPWVFGILYGVLLVLAIPWSCLVIPR